MRSASLRWETLEALKNSPKGQIKFDSHWLERGEDILAGYNEVLSLSPFAGAVLDRLTNQSLQTSFVSSGHSSPGFSVESPACPSSAASTPEVNGKPTVLSVALPSKFDAEQATSSQMNGHSESDVSSPTLPPALSVLSPRAMEIAGQIRLCEEEYRERAKMALRLRQERQEQVFAAIVSHASEQLKHFEELMEMKQRQEHQSMRDMIDRETKESIRRQEKLKEEHRIKILNLRQREAELERQREAELERQREAELERQREAEGRERLRNLNSIQEEILQLNQQLQLSTQTMTFIPPTCLSTYSTRGNQLCSQVSEVVRKTSEGDFPCMEDMNVADRTLHEMRDLLQLLRKQASEVQEKKEQEEEEELQKQAAIQAQQLAEKTAAQLAREKAERKGLKFSADDATLTWYNQLQESASQCALSFSLLSSSKDTQIKKLRMDLKKAATTPINQISSVSGNQLREIFDKLDKLLSGRPVVTGGRSVSTSDHPQGLDFVYYRTAEMLVKQGEEEVASHHKAAFPIAVVVSGIWERHPRLGDLILAHLHKKCPYAVPHYPPKKAGTSMEEYQRVLGYRVDDSGVEAHGIFLNRMTGMIRLYAGIIQLKWPDSSKQVLGPHGLNHGWRWIAQMLNMEPMTDVTATLLFDFLEVCGHALMKAYQDQFWKLILLLKEEYLPRIESVTISGDMASFARLKLFVETSLQSRYISPPEGQLTASFWSS
ncbi:nucleoporin GLE1-like [Thalassophryne amazonica]|uniref:nucleoporin GLE1-like n=1 Tax=Thalassophryne amazonica TaxID=390379 RepID=UPI001470951A|nr:nucleoporin GLE1-like [Thalassophryne amazonica]